VTVAVLGTGLIGASVGLALRADGAEVVGFDATPGRAEEARAAGALSRVAGSVAAAAAGADLVVVAVPVGRIAGVAVEALEAGARVVTDVGSAKASVVAAVEERAGAAAARFVGGHPMAGSEQAGPAGATPELFRGAAWVLTPTARTGAEAHTRVRQLVRRLGAETVEVSPEHHDELVALVSHVPQLAATTLMDLAAAAGEEHAVLLHLAAGGFRDMTRIAASEVGIWPDICRANRVAILDALDRYLAALERVRDLVAAADETGLRRLLERARDARRNLPATAALAGPLAELRVPVPDRPGVLAEVTTLAGRLGVNIADVEIAHSIEGRGGVLVMVCTAAGADRLTGALEAAGYHVSRRDLP
jgi:prephenate dehydrogenase